MKKLLLILLCLPMLFSSCWSEDKAKINEAPKQNEQLKDEIDDKKNKGEVCERYSNGDKKIVCFYEGEGVNEVITKKIHYYTQNSGGGKEKEENFKDGRKDGHQKMWYRDGQIGADDHYKFPHHLYTKTWHKNGQMRYFLNVGEGEIVRTAWYENGQMEYLKKSSKDDIRLGIHRTWHENGKLKQEDKYSNGELISSEGFSKFD